VAEPYLACTPDIGTFFGRFLVYGFTFGEAAYACQSYLSWQNTVVGDPLYRPFGKSPQVQHQDLDRRHSPLVEWSHLKVANLSLAKQAPATAVTSYLEDIDTTRHSAVLTEKLADLYADLGKPLSSIRAYRQALDLNPSPQQRLRLRLALGEQLLLQNRDEEARDNYRKLLEENPAYAGRPDIANKLDAIEARIAPPASTNAPAR
jgi:tetratricopeptide (TPR) repeat protein